MITYNDIYEAARKERYSEKLQSVSKNFISDVAEYLKEKKQITSKKEDIFSDDIVKNKKQLENAITLFKELMLRRRKKILNLVLIAAETGISRKDFENMLDIEKELFEAFMNSIDSVDKRINELLEGKEKEEKDNELIVFKEDIDEFLGPEGNKIGPFAKGQVANLPTKIAKILIDDKKADLALE